MKPVQSSRSWLIFPHVASNRTEGRRVRRSRPLLEGRASPPPAAGRPFLLLVSFTAASVRGPSSLNLLFGLPRILIRLGPHSTAYAEPGPFLVTAFTSPGHESGCRSLAHRPQTRISAAISGFSWRLSRLQSVSGPAPRRFANQKGR